MMNSRWPGSERAVTRLGLRVRDRKREEEGATVRGILFRTLAIGALAAAVLTACGPMPPATPAGEPTVAPPAETSVSSPAARATPADGSVTLGDLASRVDAAWTNVHTYRITFVGASAGATPIASPAPGASATPIQRSAAPSSMRERDVTGAQRQIVTGYGGDDHEAILSGDHIYIHGPLVAQLMPGSPDDTWLAIDASKIASDSRLAFLLGGLPQPPPPPLAGVTERLWPQTLRDLGAVAFDGRACRAYAAADTITTTGTRVDYVVAIDADGLPCFVQTSSGGVDQGRVEYTNLNGEVSIVAPGRATPVTAIPAALATPAAHD